MAQPNLLRRRLGLALRDLRKRAGLTLGEAAEAIGVSVPTLSRVELGKGAIPEDRLEAYLQPYELPETKAAEIRRLAALASSNRRSTLLHQSSNAEGDDFAGYLELEEVATEADIYTAQVVPGLFQTAEYAHALISGGVIWHTARQVRSFVELRMERQQVLRRENPLHVRCVVEEAALRRPIGDHDILKRQLIALAATVDELTNVDFRVVPTEAGAHPGVDGQFTMFSFDAGDPVVTVETMTRIAYMEEDLDIAPYTAGFTRLRKVAWSAERSREFLSNLITTDDE
ncbi:helix-turn-helix domain-containing protein [Streptomyces sp. MS19]|uniref:helix-turn-helix domain-containing protein n=1 Tax=Streptomyces sp. MS19 TaxID=3385972 RepID=UPI0039A261F6